MSQTSTAANHTYEMETDALAEIGHHGFVVDAQAMAALLFDFATHADYRAAVKREFDGIKVAVRRIPGRPEEGIYHTQSARPQMNAGIAAL